MLLWFYFASRGGLPHTDPGQTFGDSSRLPGLFLRRFRSLDSEQHPVGSHDVRRRASAISRSYRAWPRIVWSTRMPFLFIVLCLDDPHGGPAENRDAVTPDARSTVCPWAREQTRFVTEQVVQAVRQDAGDERASLVRQRDRRLGRAAGSTRAPWTGRRKVLPEATLEPPARQMNSEKQCRRDEVRAGETISLHESTEHCPAEQELLEHRRDQDGVEEHPSET